MSKLFLQPASAIAHPVKPVHNHCASVVGMMRSQASSHGTLFSYKLISRLSSDADRTQIGRQCCATFAMTASLILLEIRWPPSQVAQLQFRACFFTLPLLTRCDNPIRGEKGVCSLQGPIWFISWFNNIDLNHAERPSGSQDQIHNGM